MWSICSLSTIFVYVWISLNMVVIIHLYMYCRCRVIDITDGKYYRVRPYRVYKLIKYADI